MQLILIAGEAIGLVVGSLAAAFLLCWSLWYAFRLVLHPEWAVSAVLVLLVPILAGVLPKSPFVDMTLAFALVAAAPLWFAGRAWRGQIGSNLGDQRKPSVKPRAHQPVTSATPALSSRLYPAMTACICEARPPTRDEVHVLAARLWREGYAQYLGPQTAPASFAARRRLVRAATAALSGKPTVPLARPMV
jgi:hypothetical protein